MRFFLSRRTPPIDRILVLESGSRELVERLIPRLRATFGDETAIDLLCCRDGEPKGLRAESLVWRVHEQRDAGARRRLFAELRARKHPAAAVLFSDDPTMAPWKWAALALLPAKFLIVNENADFFWLDRSNWRTITHVARMRWGLAEGSSVRALGRILTLPLAFAFLSLYAAAVHLRRGWRLAWGGGRS